MTRLLLRYRIAVGWILATLVVYLATPEAIHLLLGLPVALLGLGIRAAAAGVVRKGSVLARDGPYQLTRHPLYLGSFMLAVGFGVMSGSLAAAVCLGVGSALTFPAMIAQEEGRLRSRFGNEFEDFSNKVPRFLPRSLPRGIFRTFSTEQYLRNREYNAALGFLVAFAALLLKYVVSDL